MSMVRTLPRAVPPVRHERVPLGMLNVMGYRGTHRPGGGTVSS